MPKLRASSSITAISDRQWALSISPGQLPPRPSGTRFIQVQRDLPGMLGRLERSYSRATPSTSPRNITRPPRRRLCRSRRRCVRSRRPACARGYLGLSRAPFAPGCSTNTRPEPGATPSAASAAPRHTSACATAIRPVRSGSARSHQRLTNTCPQKIATPMASAPAMPRRPTGRVRSRKRAA